MNRSKKAKVTLFSHTLDPLACIALGIDAWHAEVIPTSPQNWSQDELVDKFRWLLKQPHQTPFEYVNLVWVLENCSRAFQQQLTRHRVGFSYSMQSLRVINVGCFAEDGAYHCPESVIDKEAFHGAMLCTQDQYNAAVMSGEKIEDARGLLPLNIHSPITFSCSYRSLIGMLKQRLCVAAQEEWVGVSEQMRAELANVHPILAEPLDCMCKRFANNKGFCKTLHKEV